LILGQLAEKELGKEQQINNKAAEIGEVNVDNLDPLSFVKI
jgi:hypothetical protein